MHMNNLSLTYTWASIDADCNTLASMLNIDADENCVIIAINNDLIPATLVANRLGINVMQVKYGIISGVFYDTSKLPLISRPINSGTGLVPEFPKLTIVVSYYNDNAAVKDIKKFYDNIGHHVNIAAICCTPTTPSERITYQSHVDSGTKLTFPWKL